MVTAKLFTRSKPIRFIPITIVTAIRAFILTVECTTGYVRLPYFTLYTYSVIYCPTTNKEDFFEKLIK